MTKGRYNPEKVTRKMFDYQLDKLINKLARYRQKQIEIDRQQRLIIEFLSSSPHASAWEVFCEQKKKK